MLVANPTRPSHLVKLFTNSSNTSNLLIIPQTMSMTVILKVYKLIKHPYYQNCARYSIATVYVSKRHTEQTDQVRPKIPGITLVAERPHNKHGSSVFVRDGLKVNSISVCEEENVEFITVELPGVVHSLYKPPPEPFLLPPLGQRIKPHIVIGDFNSHSTLWGIHHNG